MSDAGGGGVGGQEITDLGLRNCLYCILCFTKHYLSNVHYNIVQYSTVQYSALQYSVVQYTVLCTTVLDCTITTTARSSKKGDDLSVISPLSHGRVLLATHSLSEVFLIKFFFLSFPTGSVKRYS